MNTKNLLIAALLAAALRPSAARADETVLLCFPGGPGTTEDAQPVVDRFLKRLAEQAGWKGATGAYYNDLAACRRQFGAAPPTVAMVPLDVYLEKRTSWKLSPVATLQNKETAARYYLVGRAGTTVAGLKGKKVSTALKASRRFLGRIAFGGKVNVEADFDLVATRSTPKTLKNILDGKAEAGIVTEQVYRTLASKPLTRDLVAIAVGPELPGAIVSGVGKAPAGLGDALRALCRKDAPLCAEMRITGFGAVDAAHLETLAKQLGQ